MYPFREIIVHSLLRFDSIGCPREPVAAPASLPLSPNLDSPLFCLDLRLDYAIVVFALFFNTSYCSRQVPLSWRSTRGVLLWFVFFFFSFCCFFLWCGGSFSLISLKMLPLRAWSLHMLFALRADSDAGYVSETTICEKPAFSPLPLLPVPLLFSFSLSGEVVDFVF